MRKSSGLYRILLTAWAFLCLAFIPSFISEYDHVESEGLQAAITYSLLTLNGFFILYFWLNGVKDIVYVIYYYCNKKKLNKYSRVPRWVKTIPDARVSLVYCTCNDFEPNALRKSMRQSHKRIKTVILDDSSDPKYMKRIDRFAKRHHVKVVRRKDKVGFKAGNLNNYLTRSTEREDYFVILDSDEIIPRNFCKEALRYFNYFSNVGVVQANHIATRNRTKFMKLFHIGVNSHWPTYQTVKAHCGFMSLLGHGAMVSRKCYEATGGIPHVVAEDLCFSIEARNRGYYVAFAPNITCQEEYPVDYLAFKKRHNKWTQGNLEFIRAYTKRILESKMTWFEKLDIILFTYNLPLTALFSFYIFINIMFLPMLGYSLHYPAWLLIPTVIFFIAPMANDAITWFRKIRIIHLLEYMLMTFILYGSMLFVSIKASFFGLIGRKAVFLVTPKEQQNTSFREALLQNREEIIFACILISISLLFCHSILPVLLIIIPAFLSVYLAMYSNT